MLNDSFYLISKLTKFVSLLYGIYKEIIKHNPDWKASLYRAREIFRAHLKENVGAQTNRWVCKMHVSCVQ